ncbi:hypothetical protein F751_1637 [Auxenochlorella protothecoides]|uniref:C2H2-type domain-containing protein n=1 Tax=Auxenochlorella protothecoides TaxID=3075 RepID=A0A087SU57_AUXPR|nr:hypothetical protein F751_1637 [Auxenochlorella protothecoides]KFM29261.1 hypothetical protein F751_1637 [Auxenochlorella protothecoides]
MPVMPKLHRATRVGRRRKAKEHHGDASDGGTVDKGALADCLSQTSKIAAECNTILRDLLKGRSPHHHDLQRLASQQATLSELLRMLRLDSTTADGAPLASPMDLLGPLYRSQHSPLSVLKQWDLPPPKPKARGGKGSAAAGARGGGDRAALTRHERCLSVEHYWNSLTPATRRELLRVPIDKMVEVASETGGEGAVKELWEALALLRLSGGRTAAYWRCPMCDVRVVEPSAFLQHLQLYHEDVQYADDDVPLVCTKCSREVVGAYYQNEEDGYPPVVLCMTCCWDEQVLQGTSEELSGAMQLRLPTASHILSPGSSAWSSETGDEDGSEDGEGLGLGGDWGPASDGGADEDGSGDEDGGTPPQEEAVRRSGAPCPAADDAAAGVAVQPPRRPKRTVSEHAAPPRTCLCCVAQEKPDSQLLVDAILEQLAALSSTRRDQLERVLALLMTHAHRVYSRGLASTAEQRRHVRGMRDALREDVRALDQYPPAWVAGLVDTATAFARSVPESLRSREADFLPPGCESGEREANAAFLKALEDVQGPSIVRAAASRQPSPTPARTRTPPAYAGPATPALSAPGPPHGTPPANCHGTQAGGWPGLMQGQLAVGHGQANAQATAHQAPAWEPQGGTTGESLRQHHLAPSLPGDPFAAAPPPRFDAFNGYGRVAPGLGEWPALHHRGEAEGLPPHAPPAASAYAGFDLGGGGYAPPSGPPFGAREAEAGAMDDWSELQAQLPSDLGDVLNL